MVQTLPPAIRIANVSRVFTRADGKEVRAATDLTIAVKQGEFVCLAGPSGCGKTTLLQMVSGLLLPSSGTIEVAGKEVTGPGRDRGFVFQKDSVFPWMTVLDNVQYGLKCRGMPSAERLEIARHYLSLVGLSEVEKAWPKELSGGMLKRVAIATVFANGSRVLLLDEPFGALDYVTRHQLHDVLLTLWADSAEGQKRTVLFVTHDVDEALTLADRILVFRAGRTVDDLTVTSARPRTPDSLLEPGMVELRHVLLEHLGLERPRSARPAPQAVHA